MPPAISTTRRAVTVLATAVLAASTAVALGTPAHADGQPMRCESTTEATSTNAALLAGLLGVVLGPISGSQFGISCVSAPPPQQHNFCATTLIENGLAAIGKATSDPC
jgi:hypothetical protein